MTQHLLSKRPPAASSALLASALLFAAPSDLLADNHDGTTTGSGNGGISVAILTIAEEDQNDLGTIWMGLDDCQDDVEVEFRLDNLPSDKALDIYIGASCNTQAARDGEGDDCDPIAQGLDINGTQDQRYFVKAGDIVNTAFGTDDCGSQSSKPTIWFLALNAPGTSEAADNDSYGSLELNIDTDPPDAPTRIRGGRGENEIPVSWSVGSNTVDSFEIYVDSTAEGTPIRDGGGEPIPSENDAGSEEPAAEPGASNDECGTGALASGGSAENVASLLKKSEGSATATTTTLSRSAIEGDSAAVAVVAVDEAGNRSPLSAVECVYVVPTRGVKDLYEEKYGEIPQGCPCAAAGPAQVEGALPIALALGLIAYRRRRRS